MLDRERVIQLHRSEDYPSRRIDPVYQPPCQAACPIHQDVRGYLAFIAQGQLDQALQVIRETNPLPSICGTICAHPCENQCRRGKVDEPLSVRALKRLAVEQGNLSRMVALQRASERKVAIIGSGPSGLTAAHDLIQMGYGVTIFEREQGLGGALNAFVPQYRLPRAVIERDIEGILALGVEARTGVALGRDITIPELKRQGYSAILLSLGLPLSRGLRIPGIEHPDVILALPFLREVNEQPGRPLCQGRRVIVIGGGNVAIDVARSALRTGATEVQLVCLESDAEMPAFPWEIEEAVEEGIGIACSWGPKRIMHEDGRISGLETMRCTAVFDDQGRFNPSFCEDDLGLIEGDMVIIAIGQAADLSCLEGSGVQLNDRGQIAFDPHSLATSEDGVFTCGEVITGPGTAVQAMACGRRAALCIDRYLAGESIPPPAEPVALEPLAEEVIDRIKKIGRQRLPVLPVSQRVENFDQVDLGYDRQAATREACRCLSCGAGAYLIEDKCAVCLTCLRLCPYMVPVLSDHSSVRIRNEQCQACGICVGACPAGAIGFGMATVEDIPTRLREALAGKSMSPTEHNVAVFLCSYGASLAESPAQMPSGVSIITVPCIIKINSRHLLQAFELGAESALVVGCAELDCPYERGSFWTQRNVDSAREALVQLGMPSQSLRLVRFSQADFQELSQSLDRALKGNQTESKPYQQERSDDQG